MAINPLIEFELLEIEEMESQPVQPDRFEIQNNEQASWAFRKLAAIAKREQEVKDTAEAEIARIEAWREREAKKTEAHRAFFEGLVAQYFNRLRRADPKAKVSTPYGSIAARKQQPKWEYRDEKIIAWLKERDRLDLIRVKEEPDKVAIKQAVTVVGNHVVDENGEIVEGIEVITQGEKIVIKVE